MRELSINVHPFVTQTDFRDSLMCEILLFTSGSRFVIRELKQRQRRRQRERHLKI